MFPRVTHPSATDVLRRPFDLHVLSLPPAFVLSQDQTLKFNLKIQSRLVTQRRSPIRGPPSSLTSSKHIRSLKKAPDPKASLTAFLQSPTALQERDESSET
jgi:hypothetical protein